MIKIASPLLLLFFFSLLTACGEVPIARPETPKAISTLSSTEETIKATTITTEVQPTPSSEAKITPISTEEQSKITPSPTPKPLSPLNKNLQTLILVANSEKGQQLYRVQVNEKGQKAGPVEQISYPADFRTHILGLFPSPDGKYIVIEAGGEGGPAGLKILNVATGQLTPLLGEQPKIKQRAYFLDWSADGHTLLVLGAAGSDLRDSAWLVDVNTHAYHDVNIKQVAECPEIDAASFSPDAISIVYTQRECGQNNTQLWQVALDNSPPHLVFESQARIENVWWTEEGIVFTQWMIKAGSYPWDEFTVGELYIIKADGSQPRLLSTLVMHVDNQPFLPAWSPDDQQIAFVKSSNPPSEKRLDQLISNIYIANILTGQVSQTTHLSDSQVVRPTWSPDGSRISFLVGAVGTTAPFQTEMVSINDGGDAQQLGIEEAFMKATASLTTTTTPQLDSHSMLIWLP